MFKREEIGRVLRKKRRANKLTQLVTGDIINVSRQGVSMIERGKRSLNYESAVKASKRFHFDFVKLGKELDKYKKMSHYTLANELTKLIQRRENDKIAELIKDNPIIEEFNYGHLTLLRQYCEILVLTEVDKDVELALDECFDILEIRIDKIDEFTPKITMENSYYSIILCMLGNMYRGGYYDDLLNISKKMVTFLEDMYFNELDLYLNMDAYYKRYYVISMNNLAYSYFVNGMLKEALKWCEKSIKKSNEFNIINVMPMLLELKMELLYTMGKIDEAKEQHQVFKYFCKATDNSEYFENSNESSKEKYPELFE